MPVVVCKSKEDDSYDDIWKCSPTVCDIWGAEYSEVKGSPIYDAHLIAAAPDMYEMLSELSKHNYFKEQLPFSYDKVLEVLAKARGEQ